MGIPFDLKIGTPVLETAYGFRLLNRDYFSRNHHRFSWTYGQVDLATLSRRREAHCNAALGRVVSAENGGKLFERIKAGTPAGCDKRYRNPLTSRAPCIQRVFAHAAETGRSRELSALQGGFLLLLFFARQRKVKITASCR